MRTFGKKTPSNYIVLKIFTWAVANLHEDIVRPIMRFWGSYTSKLFKCMLCKKNFSLYLIHFNTRLLKDNMGFFLYTCLLRVKSLSNALIIVSPLSTPPRIEGPIPPP